MLPVPRTPLWSPSQSRGVRPLASEDQLRAQSGVPEESPPLQVRTQTLICPRVRPSASTQLGPTPRLSLGTSHSWR